MSIVPAIIEEEKMVHRKKFNQKANFDFAIFLTQQSPLKSKNLNRKKRRKKVKTMAGKDQKPNRVKNTTISLPLIKPDPTTVPTIAKKVR